MPNLVISFSDLDFKGTDQNLHDPVVISMVARNYIVRKVLVDQGSSTDILYTSTLQKMQIFESSHSLYHGDLVGLSGEWVNVLGVVELSTTFRIESNIKTIGVSGVHESGWVRLWREKDSTQLIEIELGWVNFLKF